MKLTRVFERMGLLEQVTDPSAVEVPDPRPEPPPEQAQPSAGGFPDARLPEARSDPPAVIPNRPLEDIYADAGVPDSPFSAEKLLKLLEALANLPDEVRNQAVRAIDAADDSWTIEDPVLDARRRIQALEREQHRLQAVTAEIEAHSAAELKAQDDYLSRATAQIRQQIAELEDLLGQESATVTETKEKIRHRLAAVRDTSSREQSRLDREIARLRQLEALLVEPNPPASGEDTDETDTPG